MSGESSRQEIVDKFEIIENSTTALCCRDAGDWPGLAACFLPDAQVTTSWFNGTAREFAERSQRMMSGHHPGDTQRHVMSNPRATLNGDRAVCEFYVVLHQGRTLDGHEFDLQTWSVTLDLYARANGAWRIARRMNIYEKDRMDPHVPGSVPPAYYQQLDLARYPAAVRFHCYRNEKSSGEAPKNLIVKGTAAETAARAAARDWLLGGR